MINKKSDLKFESQELRKEIVHAFNNCGGGHYGGSLSVIDILLTLYNTILRVNPEKPLDPGRDRMILSKGHAAMAYYAILRKFGFATAPLDSYGKFNSVYEGHPDMSRIPGIDFNTGSLGQGLSVGIGMAIALQKTDARVWVVLGDGECQEGQIWEAALQAPRFNLDSLCVIIDSNKHQEWGWSYNSTINNEPIPDLSEKWKAFGWHVIEVDGHNHEELTNAFQQAIDHKKKPTAIIANTIKGKGIPLMELNPERFHCTEMSHEEQLETDKYL